MDPVRFSTIAHRNHRFCSPLGQATVERSLERLALEHGQRALDVGCGKGEMLLRVLERYPVTGVGVDPNREFLAGAQRRATRRGLAERLDLRAATIAETGFPPDHFRFTMAIGSTHAYGGLAPTLEAFRQLLAPGGRMLLGEGYWKCEPDPGYLSLLGGTREEFTDHPGNVRAGTDRGLTLIDAWVSSEDEWDDYEGLYARSIEQHLLESPDDPDRAAMKDRIDRWQDGYRRWGRRTLGFGLYLFRT